MNPRNVSTVDCSRRPSAARTAVGSIQAQEAKARKDNKRALNQVSTADIPPRGALT